MLAFFLWVELMDVVNAELLWLSLNVFSLSSLKITTSTSDDETSFGGEIVIIRELFTASHSIFPLKKPTN